MFRIPLVMRLFSVIVLALGAQAALASTTNVAGSCKPTLPSYNSISAALAATPPYGTVLVCPQTFNEQVEITQPVTLQGTSSGDSDQPVLAPPAGGLTQTATNSFGSTVFYQLWVNNVSGPVNISNITVDGTGNGVSCSAVNFSGIFYQNSPGSVSRVTTRNQKGSGCGVGINVEGGSSNPPVTIENSSIHDFDNTGISTATNSGSSALTATIKGNEVNAAGALIGVYLLQGSTNTMTGNFISGGSAGIWSNAGATGSISNNTLMNDTNAGIYVAGDGLSVTANKIMFSTYGIYLSSALATISGNSISSTSAGIDFACLANPNVHSNVINEAEIGVYGLPSGVSTPNTYANVGTIKTGC